MSASSTWAVTSSVGGSITSPKSHTGNWPTSELVLSTSNAPHPPPAHCMASSQSTPRRIAPSSRDTPDRMSEMSTSAVSSVSGYHSLWNSNAHPPASPRRGILRQSPSRVISRAISHARARSTASSSPAVPESWSAMAARQVSHTGEMHDWMRRRPSRRSANVEKPSRARTITGWSSGVPITWSAMIEYTHGGWMPAHEPSTSWRSRIHARMRRSDARRMAPMGWRL